MEFNVCSLSLLLQGGAIYLHSVGTQSPAGAMPAAQWSSMPAAQ